MRKLWRKYTHNILEPNKTIKMDINSENDTVTDLILHLRMNLTYVEVKKKKKHNSLLKNK